MTCAGRRVDLTAAGSAAVYGCTGFLRDGAPVAFLLDALDVVPGD